MIIKNLYYLEFDKWFANFCEKQNKLILRENNKLFYQNRSLTLIIST